MTLHSGISGSENETQYLRLQIGNSLTNFTFNSIYKRKRRKKEIIQKFRRGLIAYARKISKNKHPCHQCLSQLGLTVGAIVQIQNFAKY